MIEPTRFWDGGCTEHRLDEIGNMDELHNTLRARRQRQNTTGCKTKEQKEVFLSRTVDHRRAEYHNLEGVGRSEASLLSDKLTPSIGSNRVWFVARFNRPPISCRTRRSERAQIDQAPWAWLRSPHGLNKPLRSLGIRAQILLLGVGFCHCGEMKDNVDLRDRLHQTVTVFQRPPDQFDPVCPVASKSSNITRRANKHTRPGALLDECINKVRANKASSSGHKDTGACLHQRGTWCYPSGTHSSSNHVRSDAR